jgi:hypothetical protein
MAFVGPIGSLQLGRLAMIPSRLLEQATICPMGIEVCDAVAPIRQRIVAVATDGLIGAAGSEPCGLLLLDLS